MERKQRGFGSGCILDAEGHILTNNHVIAGADELKVTLGDGREFDAEVVGTDEDTDVAVIQIVGDAKDLPTIVMGWSLPCTRTNPKSTSTGPLSLMITFDGFMSRWRIGCPIPEPSCR